MIDNIQKFEAFLFTHYPEIFKEVKYSLLYSPSNIYKDTINVFNPYSENKNKALEFKNIIAEYGYTPSTRFHPPI
ncbi:MAG TPA: hypothetical protein VIL78_06515 [Hanamia sp.]